MLACDSELLLHCAAQADGSVVPECASVTGEQNPHYSTAYLDIAINQFLQVVITVLYRRYHQNTPSHCRCEHMCEAAKRCVSNTVR